mmetsp:Transcript_51934/g.150896  ORF Transcript_51934/g.150896 Transcript_51934/m.150896 type:complete len:440 (+) Transcript_51934:115-1434(+)
MMQIRRALRSAVQVASMDCAALSRATRRSLAEGDLERDLWQTYAARASELLTGLTATDSVRLAAAFSTARVQDFALFSRFSSRILECIQDCDAGDSQMAAVDMKRLATAFGRVRAFDSELMEKLVPMIVHRVEEFRPRDLVRIADAYARMPVRNLDLFALVADALPPYLYDLEPPELANLCRSFAEVAFYNLELVDALCAEVDVRLRSFGALDCLTFLDGLSRLHAGLPDDLKRNDNKTVSSAVLHLSRLLGTLSARDLVRTLSMLVRFDHYDPRVVHGRLCPALAQRLGQLQGHGAFTHLAELIHGLSLLPAQSHKSTELAFAALAALRRGGVPRGWVEPQSMALAAAALAQLGQSDEELADILHTCVVGGRASDSRDLAPEDADSRGSGRQGLLQMASDDELLELQHAFSLCQGEAKLQDACIAIKEELDQRSVAAH